MTGILFLLSSIWLGFVLDEEFSLSRGDFSVRLAAAVVLGCFWSTWIVYLLALAFGFNLSTMVGGMGLILMGNVLAWRFRRRNLLWFASLFSFNRPFWKASFVPTVLITAFFAVCVWIDDNGNIMFRGNSDDLAYHMATASAFLDQHSFPPPNPECATARLCYHFMADFHSAILCRGGFSLFWAFKIPMVLFAFSLATLTCHFLFSALKTQTATVFAGLLFFFGHIGIINLIYGVAGYPVANVPLSLRSWFSIENHLLFPYFNFLNILIDYFQPQLPFLFGWPLAMLILVAIYRRFAQQAPTDRSTCFLLGLVAFLPLLHIHTFLIIGPLVGLMVLFEPAPHRMNAAPREGFSAKLFALTTESGTSDFPASDSHSPQVLPPSAPKSGSPHVSLKILALFLATIPVGLQLGWLLSQDHPPGYSGFDVNRWLASLPEIPNFLHLHRCWFWIRAAGPPLVLGAAGILFSIRLWFTESQELRRGEIALLAMLFVTGSYFILINFYRFSPSWGDNNKFVLYLDLVLCVYAGRLLAFFWEKSLSLRITACLLVSLGAVVPTAIEWVVRYQGPPQQLFSAGDRLVGEWLRLNTPPDAVFLTTNSTINLVPALARRSVVNGAYTHTGGYADDTTDALVARAYREANPFLITHVRVTHIFVGPIEEQQYKIDRAAMGRRFRTVYDQSCLGARYSVYETGGCNAEDVRRDQESENSKPSGDNRGLSAVERK